MLADIRQRFVRLFLASAVILMMVGTPMVAPVYADCASGTSSCST
jgi:predicted tellurium resistance membrane protein TerC